MKPARDRQHVVLSPTVRTSLKRPEARAAGRWIERVQREGVLDERARPEGACGAGIEGPREQNAGMRVGDFQDEGAQERLRSAARLNGQPLPAAERALHPLPARVREDEVVDPLP